MRRTFQYGNDLVLLILATGKYIWYALHNSNAFSFSSFLSSPPFYCFLVVRSSELATLWSFSRMHFKSLPIQAGLVGLASAGYAKYPAGNSTTAYPTTGTSTPTSTLAACGIVSSLASVAKVASPSGMFHCLS